MPRSPAALSPLARELLAAAKASPISQVSKRRTRNVWTDWEPAVELRLKAGEDPPATIDWFITEYARRHKGFKTPAVKSAKWQQFSAVVYRVAKNLRKAQAQAEES